MKLMMLALGRWVASTVALLGSGCWTEAPLILGMLRVWAETGFCLLKGWPDGAHDSGCAWLGSPC